MLDIVLKNTFGFTIVEGGDIHTIHNTIRFKLKICKPRLFEYGCFFLGY
jgi:hypothetical protein